MCLCHRIQFDDTSPLSALICDEDNLTSLTVDDRLQRRRRTEERGR